MTLYLVGHGDEWEERSRASLMAAGFDFFIPRLVIRRLGNDMMFHDTAAR